MVEIDIAIGGGGSARYFTTSSNRIAVLSLIKSIVWVLNNVGCTVLTVCEGDRRQYLTALGGSSVLQVGSWMVWV